MNRNLFFEIAFRKKLKNNVFVYSWLNFKDNKFKCTKSEIFYVSNRILLSFCIAFSLLMEKIIYWF